MEYKNSETVELAPDEVSKNENTVVTPPPKKSNKKLILIGSVFVLVLVLIVGLFSYKNYSKGLSNKKEVTEKTPAAQVTPDNSPRILESSDVAWYEDIKPVTGINFFTEIDQKNPYSVIFLKEGPAPTGGGINTGILTQKYEPTAKYYLVGKAKNPKYQGDVYLVIVSNLPDGRVYKGIPQEKDITYDYKKMFLIIKKDDGTFVVGNDYNNESLFTKNTADYQSKPVSYSSNINYLKSLYLDEVGSKHSYKTQASDYSYSVHADKNELFSENGLYLVKNLGNGYKLYSSENNSGSNISLKSAINPSFVLRLPTGVAAEFYSSREALGPSFDGSYRESIAYKQPSFAWSEPIPQALPKEPDSPGAYAYFSSLDYTTDYDGCQQSPPANIANQTQSIDVDKDLIEVAKSNAGDVLYDFKSKDYKIFKDFWINKVQSSGIGLSYDDYLNYKPILIWKDEFGVYKVAFRVDFVNTQCNGEPVIYLYPVKTTNVKVVLDKSIDLTESTPSYSSSWNVVANPNGSIAANNRTYPYLYWEGSSKQPESAISQAVIEKSKVPAYIENQLKALNLNDKERKDFKTYWLPKLNSSEYYLLTFYSTNDLEKIIPLSVSPKPDTLIRVLMSYKELNKKINIKEFNNAKSVQRKGFTVVEWGGVLNQKDLLAK